MERNAAPLGSALRSLGHNLSRIFSYCLLHDRPTEGCAIASSDFRELGIRRAIAARSPAVILLDECALVSGGVAQQGRKPTLWAAATSLAECAPLVVVGSSEHQTELSALLAAGGVDLVVCSESSLQLAVGLVERRLRQRHLRITSEAASRRVHENHMDSQQETRDFGEVLRLELNNPLTGILR